MRSQVVRGDQGRPTWTSRSMPPACCFIHRATGSLRRPAEITRSGHGGARSLEVCLSIPASVARRLRLMTNSHGCASICLTSYSQPSCSASARTCVLSPAFLPSKHQSLLGGVCAKFVLQVGKPGDLWAGPCKLHYCTIGLKVEFFEPNRFYPY